LVKSAQIRTSKVMKIIKIYDFDDFQNQFCLGKMREKVCGGRVDYTRFCAKTVLFQFMGTNLTVLHGVFGQKVYFSQ